MKRPHTHEMITISPIMESDVEVIEDMAWKAFNSITTIHSILESYVGLGYAKDAIVEHIRELYQLSPEEFLVARMDNKPIGFIASQINSMTSIALIDLLATLPGFWGKGIGTQLLKASLELFLMKGISVVWISYDIGNDAAGHLYQEKSGFTPFGKANFYAKKLSDSDALTRTSSISRVTIEKTDDKQGIGQLVRNNHLSFFVERMLKKEHRLAFNLEVIIKRVLEDQQKPPSETFLITEDDLPKGFILARPEVGGRVVKLSQIIVPDVITGTNALRSIIQVQASKGAKAIYCELSEGNSLEHMILTETGFTLVHGLHLLSYKIT